MAKTIGIVGGGQLGRMLTEAALPLGFKVVVINPEANSPAAQVGAQEIVADLQDPEAIRQLAEASDFVTVEIEHLNADVLAKLEKAGTSVHPSAKTIKLIQDKLAQNEFYRKNKLPTPGFVQIDSQADARQALKEFNGRMILKTRFGGYDGRGNQVIKSAEDLNSVEDFERLYAEEFIDFNKELAVIVARDVKGNIKTFPVVETIHKDNICHEVLCPAPMANDVKQAAEQLANQVVDKLGGAGVFAIEMFVTGQGQVLINEIAPRVHNSGHHTIEACRTSQFEQHIRAISGMELGEPSLKVPAAVMINILGERDGPVELKGEDEVKKMGGVFLHLYGKSPTKVARKMGHITAIADTIEAAKVKAELARSKISV